jgi:hypothetical protein
MSKPPPSRPTRKRVTLLALCLAAFIMGALVAIFLLPARPADPTTGPPDTATGPDQATTPERQNVRALDEVI